MAAAPMLYDSKVSQMFLLRPPPERLVHKTLESLIGSGFSYPEVGMTARSAPPGYRVRRAACTLGCGAEVFGRARQAIGEWRMFDLGWLRVVPHDLPVAVGSTVSVLVRHFGFWSLNFSRIV